MIGTSEMSHAMFVHKEKQQGFAFVSALLLLILISALAVTLVYQTMTETRIGGSDQQNNIAMYAAESGLEKMSAAQYGELTRLDQSGWRDELKSHDELFEKLGTHVPDALEAGRGRMHQKLAA